MRSPGVVGFGALGRCGCCAGGVCCAAIAIGMTAITADKDRAGANRNLILVISYQLPATSYQLPATSFQLPATSYHFGAPSGLGAQPVRSTVHIALAIFQPSSVLTRLKASIPQWLNVPLLWKS